MKIRFYISGIWTVLATIFAPISLAQTSLVLKEPPKTLDTKVMGWSPTAALGLNAAFSSSSHVVGQANGSSQTYGTNLNSTYNFLSELSEWQNSVSYTGATTKTPTQTGYVKSRDELKIESLYLYKIPSAPDWGPYVKASIKSPIFWGQDVRSTPVTYTVVRRDGSSTSIANAKSFKLTDGFKPMTTRESAGAFWKAMDSGRIRLDFRIGMGAEQVAADGQYAVTGDNSDGSVGIKELNNISQLGLEAAITAKGKIDEKSEWSAGVETLTPFVSTKDASDRRDALRLTVVDGYAKLTNTIASWASLSYDYKLTIQPQLVDVVQQSHMFVLNVNYNLF